MSYIVNYDDDSKSPEGEVSEWMRFGMRLGVSAALHPMEYSKVLIQLGYEPIAAVPGRTILGKPCMLLPNVFTYAAHIRRVDGFFGWYRGLAPKLVGSICGTILSEKFADRLGLKEITEDDDLLSDEEKYAKFKVNLKRDVVLTASCIVVTQPFHVISIRMMAQFVGRETLYKSLLGSMAEIYRHEGILGFFSGLMPKLLCDLACVVLSSSTVYLLNKYVIKDKLGRQYSAAFTQFAFSSVLYPLNVVSTCMNVSGSRLKVAQEPFMPKYNGWVSCFNDLQNRNELKRGSSLFWRTSGGFTSPVLKASYVPLPQLAKYQ